MKKRRIELTHKVTGKLRGLVVLVSNPKAVKYITYKGKKIKNGVMIVGDSA